MKKAGLFIVFIPLFANYLSAQDRGIFLGYNVTAGLYTPVNKVIDNHNKLRTTIKRPMSRINTMRGFTLGIGFYDALWLEGEFTGRKGSSYAIVTDSIGDIRRDFKIRNDAAGLTIGGCKSSDRITWGAGLGFEATLVSTGTRYYYLNGNDPPGYGGSIGEMDINIGISPSAFINYRIKGGVVMGIRPSYTVYVSKQDMNDENEAINYTGPQFYYQKSSGYIGRLNQFCVQGRLIILLN